MAPQRTDFWLNHGRLSLRCGEIRQAEKSFRRATELSPNRAEGFAALSSLALHPARRNPRHAVALAKKAVELEPSAPNYSILSTAYLAANEREKAKSAAERALRLDPNNPRYRQDYFALQQNAHR
jgi:tetratricopeptide (TPR) repeat protein